MHNEVLKIKVLGESSLLGYQMPYLGDLYCAGECLPCAHS